MIAGQILTMRGIARLAAALDDERSALHCASVLDAAPGCILPPSDHERGEDAALCALKAHLPADLPWPEGLPPCA